MRVLIRIGKNTGVLKRCEVEKEDKRKRGRKNFYNYVSNI
jgi:hypothetical protein